ncbi:MAG: energy transducer TonB [Aquificaceae bacterium]|nr:energy transducer TonB [Aquificaceae bacterium]
MSYSLRAYLISFLIHATLFLMLSPLLSLQEARKPVEIDLTLQEPEKTTPEVENIREELKPYKPERVRAEGFHKDPHLWQSRVEGGESKLAHKATTEETLAMGQGEAPIQEGSAGPNEGLGSVEKGNAPIMHPPALEGQGEATKILTAKLTSPETQKEQYLKEKLQSISQIVQRNISYPPLARRMGWEGRVVLAIRIGEDGSLREVRVLESSGYDILDRNAVETVRRLAGLLPKPPVEVMVKLPVKYGLE